MHQQGLSTNRGRRLFGELLIIFIGHRRLEDWTIWRTFIRVPDQRGFPDFLASSIRRLIELLIGRFIE